MQNPLSPYIYNLECISKGIDRAEYRYELTYDGETSYKKIVVRTEKIPGTNKLKVHIAPARFKEREFASIQDFELWFSERIANNRQKRDERKRLLSASPK